MGALTTPEAATAEPAPPAGLTARLQQFLGVNRHNIGPALLTVAMTAFLSIIACVSYPTIIFSGALAPYLNVGIGIGFFSAAVLGAVMAPGSSYPGAVTYAQSQPLVILGIIASAIVTALHASGQDARILPTVLAAIMVGSISYGAFLLFLGYFRLGNLIRYIPFPVMGGFLAGIGWLLLKAAIVSMSGLDLRLGNIADLFQPAVLPQWALGIVLGIVIRIVQARWRRAATLPLVLVVAMAAFWMIVLLTGTPDDELRSRGWLPAHFAESEHWLPFRHLVLIDEAAWSLFPAYIDEFATLAVMSAFALLLSANAIELGTRRDLDLNRELRSAGLANILCGLGGGLPGYYSLSASRLSSRRQTPIRFVGLATSAICFVALLTSASAVSYVPKLVAGGLVAEMALGFLLEWLYGSWRRLPPAEFLVLILVFATVVVFGFMEGIALGMAAGVALFVIRYSKIGVARDVLSGTTYHSNVDRAEAQQALLHEFGDEIHILRLQGFVFFGTANALVRIVRKRVAQTAKRPLRYLLVDFHLVTGMDASAVVSFAKLAQYAEDSEFTLVLCRLTEEFAALLRRDDVDAATRRHVRVFRDLDHGLEWAEDDLLARHGANALAAAAFDVQIRTIYPEPADAARFKSYCEALTYAAGDTLIRQGTVADDILYIESGRVAITLESTGGEVRLKSMGAGTIVGEIAFYLGAPRSASVVAAEPTTAFRLTSERLRAMQRDDPRIATVFHQHMARILSNKLVETNRLVSALNQ